MAQVFIDGNNVGNNYWINNIQASGTLSILECVASVTNYNLITTRVFRDTTRWHHLVVAMDTNQVIPANRLRVYIDGEGITAFSTASYPAQFYNHSFGNQGVTHFIGGYPTIIGLSDGYLSDFYFIDGQALDPSYFGQQDLVYDQWVPKAYSGTYSGVNSFHLTFSDNSSVAALGYDTSGGAHHFSPTGFSVTTDSDSLLDTPTKQYPIIDVNRSVAGSGITNGGLQISSGGNYAQYATMLVPQTEQGYYWECKYVAGAGGGQQSIGVVDPNVLSSAAFSGGTVKGAWFFYDSLSGTIIADGNIVWGANVGAIAANDVFRVAVKGNKVWLGKNNSNSWYNITGNSTWTTTDAEVVAGLKPTFVINTPIVPFFYNYLGNQYPNFGQKGFDIGAPSGFLPLNSQTIPNNNTDSTMDLVWVKDRDTISKHMNFNSLSGPNKYLSSNMADPETTDVNTLRKFEKGGFSIGNQTNINVKDRKYIAHCWSLGNVPTVVNAAGSNGATIQSTVKANPLIGMSMVTTAGTGVAGTVYHGLSKAPELIISYNLTTGYSHPVWHSSFVTASNTDYLYLDSNIIKGGSGAGSFWNATPPTSSVFSVGTDLTVNGSGKNIIFFCFHSVPGLCKIGDYKGNASADGTFVDCGFEVGYIVIKGITGAVSNWHNCDAARNPTNPVNLYTDLSLNGAEATTTYFDFVSTGFKLRGGAGIGANESGDTYAYVAFAKGVDGLGNLFSGFNLGR